MTVVDLRRPRPTLAARRFRRVRPAPRSQDCKPLTIQHQEADTPHEVLRQAERINSRDGPSGRFGALLFGIAIGLMLTQFAAKVFSPAAKGYQRAKESD
jgi:hypothetical protein